MKKYLVGLILFGALAVSQVLAEKITFDDLYSIPRAGSPRISPDGSMIAFHLSERDKETGESSKHIWVMESHGSNMRQLTRGEKGASSPKWSPDGMKIAFARSNNKGLQIWTIPIDGGEAYRVTSISTGVGDFDWSPDGKSLIFSSFVYPDCLDDLCNSEKQDSVDNLPTQARTYDHLMFRHYKYWYDGKVERLFSHSIETGQTRQITFTHDNAPPSPVGGHYDFAISPENSEFVYAANTDSIPTLSTNSDVFLVSMSEHDPVRISPGEGSDEGAQFSPNGRYISYLSMARAGYESDQRDFMLYDKKTGIRVNLTEDFDRSVGWYAWHPDSESVYFLALDKGYMPLWRLNIKTRKIEKLLGEAVYSDLAMSPDGKHVVVSRSVSDQPYELHRYDIRTGKLTRLTRFSEEVIEKLDLSKAEEFWFAGFNGDSVHGFLTLPPEFDANEDYPLVLLIHGGPQWCWLGDFNFYGWNTQLMASQGYVVAQIDPHGSAGYGLAFKEYVSGNWGRGDYEDLMLGVDHLLAAHEFVDSTRMAALGRSYGGFMTNWICGHTNRFRCLVTIDGTFNHVSDYGTTDELWFAEWEFNGTPWTNREEYIRSSPSTYVENFKTPTLVIHGEMDYRVDPSEAFQMFTALQRMSVPSEIVFFPDEGHSIGKLVNLRFVYEKQFEWLRRWLD